jgi:hypothetical protein
VAGYVPSCAARAVVNIPFIIVFIIVVAFVEASSWSPPSLRSWTWT